MIRENQRLLNSLNVVTDGVILFSLLPLSFWLRFYVLPGGIISVPFEDYLILALILTATHLFSYAAFGMYHSNRKTRLMRKLSIIWLSGGLNMAVLLSFLFVQKNINFSRWTLAIFFLLSCVILSAKRIAMRLLLRFFRRRGYNQKRVLLIGADAMGHRYLQELKKDSSLGYQVVGYIASKKKSDLDVPYLGNFGKLVKMLEKHRPDEVISAIEIEDFHRTPQIIEACEKAGVKLSIIPFYAEYIHSARQFDEFNGIPLMNIRHIPLDNWANAFAKRAMDIIGSSLLLILTSPIMLLCAIGVKLSSPGPILFRQERIGRNKKPFKMYKFRSMRVNSEEKTGWSSDQDDRKTKFGSFIRKFSLDEFPQFFNVLKGDMSLVGPRPEVPHYVELFKEEVPLYMVKHQVRPGITGWAQINGFRGDTSIKGRIQHDIYYIEHWSLLFDLRILWTTVFGGKFMNSEQLN
ncbi:MAG: undecaprenyl-phosphate glucose phosphotransferase [Ruminococcaceae bacterium]|nr:undecaprenyl-phosphate glucose phosphotransferase [Oscillospiraceae bacterium]